MNRPGLAQRRPLLLSVLLMFLTVLVAGGIGVYVLSDPDLSPTFTMIRVATTVQDLYQTELDWGQLVQAGMAGMFDRLDRYSGYVEPRRWDRMREELSGGYTGIGVSVTQHDDGLLIMSVREDGPAAASGILNGDVIVRIDSVSLRGLDVYEATNVLRGPVDTEVEIGLYRAVDNDTLTVKVQRRRIDFVHIPYAGYTPDSVIYIRLLDFDAGASHDVEAALDSLMTGPGRNPRGVILDLRGNPGGLFSEAYGTANLFLEAGQFIVGTDGRSHWSDERHFSDGHDLAGGLPLVLLVDYGSASSSEIVAGSLHQLGRATLLGDTTFGKGLVQGFNRLHDGSAVRLTISRYYLAGGLYLNEFDSALIEIGHGLVPDRIVPFPEEAAFPRALERSLLLNRFANAHMDEIVDLSDRLELHDDWVDRFERFARDEGFEFRSLTTDRAEGVVELTVLEEMSAAVRRAAERFLEQSRQADADQYREFREYIKLRLKQIACERKFGAYSAYRDAIVPVRPDIRLAAEIIKAGGR